MKKILGRFLVLFYIFFSVNIFASTYEWESSISKKNAVVNEAVYIKYTCRFSDKGELYTILFNQKGAKDKFDIELLKKTDKLVDLQRVSIFEYILFPKKEGILEFTFDTLMKKTTQDFINNSTTGRDDDRGDDDFSQRIIRQNILLLNVNSSDASLVGDFKVEVKKDTQKIKAFEPYHLEIRIKGRGNFQKIKVFEFNIPNVKVFSQKQIQKIKLTKDGYKGVSIQKFAFVSESDFSIPKITFEYFDRAKNKIVKKEFKEIDIKVSKAYKKEQLLDAEVKDVEFNFEYIYYILTFISGFLLAKIKFQFKRKEKVSDILSQKVQKCSSLEELNILLVLEDDRKFKSIILDIELKKINSLSDVKKRIKRLR